jgi:hypothetical protein
VLADVAAVGDDSNDAAAQVRARGRVRVWLRAG